MPALIKDTAPTLLSRKTVLVAADSPRAHGEGLGATLEAHLEGESYEHNPPGIWLILRAYWEDFPDRGQKDITLGIEDAPRLIALLEAAMREAKRLAHHSELLPDTEPHARAHRRPGN